MRVAIVEDDPQVRQTLTGYVHRYERQYGVTVDLTVFEDGDELVSALPAVYDMVFLDIQMKRMDGMETARRLRKVDREATLVFLTNMAQFAIQGYEVEAANYLLKPVPYFAFARELKKAADRLEQRRAAYLTVPVAGGFHRVDIRGIYYFESDGRKVHIYAKSGDLVTPRTLREFEQELAPRGFARCNNGYLVNLGQVVGVCQNTVTVGPYELQISRPKKKAFMEALTDYIGGDLL